MSMATQAYPLQSMATQEATTRPSGVVEVQQIPAEGLVGDEAVGAR